MSNWPNHSDLGIIGKIFLMLCNTVFTLSVEEIKKYKYTDTNSITYIGILTLRANTSVYLCIYYSSAAHGLLFIFQLKDVSAEES